MLEEQNSQGDLVFSCWIRCNKKLTKVRNEQLFYNRFGSTSVNNTLFRYNSILITKAEDNVVKSLVLNTMVFPYNSKTKKDTFDEDLHPVLLNDRTKILEFISDLNEIFEPTEVLVDHFLGSSLLELENHGIEVKKMRDLLLEL